VVSDNNASPNTPFLTSVEGIVETVLNEGTGVAEFLSGEDGFAADFRVWQIFREEHMWQPLAGYFSYCFDFEEKFARWMSVVEHRV